MDVFEQNESLFLSSLLRGGALGNHFGKPIIGSLAKSHYAILGSTSPCLQSTSPDKSWLPPGMELYCTSDFGSMLISCYPGT